jgi:hypothetical protein
MATTSTPVQRRCLPGRFWLALGLVLPLLGILAYVVQLSLHRLKVPWYLPLAATLGALFVVVSLWRARSLWRVLALLLVLLVSGATWVMVLGLRLPAYTGPVAQGKPFPKFATRKADGSSFTRQDLEGEQDNVLVFFRGRW